MRPPITVQTRLTAFLIKEHACRFGQTLLSFMSLRIVLGKI